MELNKNNVGLSLGIIFAILHLIWIIAVVGNFADTLLTWWYNGHFIEANLKITEFKFGTALITIIRSFIGGYIIGWIFTFIYNKLNTSRKDK